MIIDNENTGKLVALLDEEAVVFKILRQRDWRAKGIEYGDPKPTNVHFSAEDARTLTKFAQQTEDEIIDDIISKALEQVFVAASQRGETCTAVYSRVFNQYSDEKDLTARRAEVVTRLREMGYKVKYECTKIVTVEDSECGYSSRGHIIIDWSADEQS